MIPQQQVVASKNIGKRRSPARVPRRCCALCGGPVGLRGVSEAGLRPYGVGEQTRPRGAGGRARGQGKAALEEISNCN